jgi:hypothetical protein
MDRAQLRMQCEGWLAANLRLNTIIDALARVK